ncbi:MAG: IucA/IucC family protein [Chthoniobacterales bacterium]
MPQSSVRIAEFDGLDARTRRWLDHEQTLNERIFNDVVLRPIDQRSNTVRAIFSPEQRPVWEQDVVWLPDDLVRRYGPVHDEVRASVGLEPRPRHTPLILHPQTPAAHRRLRHEFGAERLTGTSVTPTSSYRSVVVWTRDGKRAPALLKLSLGAIIALTQRALRENQVARAVVISSVFDTIPIRARERVGFDWFAEPAGMVETRSRHGWLLRKWPRSLTKPGTTTLLPTFSLISSKEGRQPLLVRFIRESRMRAEDFVVERLLRPYVTALSYLLFEHGLQYEGHSQNVLYELDPWGRLTGRLILRDLADTSVNLAFRIAKKRPLPIFAPGLLPKDAPFPVAGNAADYRTNARRRRVLRGFDTVERYGLYGFVWAINTSLARFFPRYKTEQVEQRYLELWQQAAIDSLGVRPLFRRKPKGLATDEAIAYFLGQVDWRALGARAAKLPENAEPLIIDGRMRRRNAAGYDRLECAWGDLFIGNGLPGFFRPAF